MKDKVNRVKVQLESELKLAKETFVKEVKRIGKANEDRWNSINLRSQTLDDEII